MSGTVSILFPYLSKLFTLLIFIFIFIIEITILGKRSHIAKNAKFTIIAELNITFDSIWEEWD